MTEFNYLRPDADDADGNWTNELDTNLLLYQSVDETVADDGDYVKSEENPAADVVRFRLSNPTYTTAPPAKLRIRFKRSGTGVIDLTVRVLEGTTPIVEWVYTDIADSFVDVEETLTSGEYAAITDFTNLFVELEASESTDWWLEDSVIDLDFETPQYHRSKILATDLLSITRASIGYAQTVAGTLVQFAANQLRITDKGLLIEDARTNNTAYSQDLDSVGWGEFNCTATDNDTTAPDGTMTAAKLQSAGAGFSILQGANPTTLITNTPATISVYAKLGVAGDYIQLTCADFSASQFGSSFNLATGTVGTTFTQGLGTVNSASIEALANGWFRCVVVGQVSSGSAGFSLCVGADAHASSMNNAAGSGYDYFWGAQLENGVSFPSSYIPTITAAATRAADIVKAAGTALSVLQGSTVSCVADVKASDVSVISPARLLGTADAEMPMGVNNSTSLAAFQFPSFGGMAATLGNSLRFIDGVKCGCSWDSSTSSLVGGGGTVSTDDEGFAFSTDVGIGSDSSTNLFYGYFRRLTAWNTKLADATLQDYTDPSGSAPSGYAVDMDFVNDAYAIDTTATPVETVLMLHGDGVDASTSISDSTGRHFLSAGPTSSIPEIDTAQSKFGGASILCAGANSAISDVSTDFLFGTGDFTVDFWLQRNTTGQCNLIGLNSGDFTIYLAASGGVLKLFWSGADRIVGSTSIANGVWRHIAFTRSGNDHRLFLDGVQEGSTYTAANNYTSDQITVGHGSLMTGWVDEVRVLKGTAAWTANFTPPTEPYDVGIGPYDVLSITRASIGYAQTVAGTLTQFAANQLRITDKGLLIEDARTNVCVQSEDFSATWANDGTTETVDQAVAPNGTTTMDQIFDGVANQRHIIYQQLTITAGATYTYSVYLKDVDRRYVDLTVVDGSGVASLYCFVDLQTGVLGDSGILTAGTGTTFVSATIEALAGGIYRVSLTGITSSTDTNPFFIIALSDRSTNTGVFSFGAPSYTGTNKSVYAWGAQAELGSFASSYIPTAGAAATRALDLVKAASTLIGVGKSAEVSVYADVKFISAPTIANGMTFPRIIGITSGTYAGSPLFPDNSNTLIGMYSDANGSANATLGNSLTFTDGVKVAGNWSHIIHDRAVVGGGGTVTHQGPTITFNFDTEPLTIGNNNGASDNMAYAYFRRVAFWDTQLADATLQALTAP